PITKAELIALIKKTGARSITQGEIASEVEQRGIAFAVDEKTLNELQQNGARTFLLDAIKRVASNGGKPQTEEVNTAGIDDEEARKRAEAEMVAKLPLLEQARRNALEYAEELPNFIVSQTIHRYVRTPDAKDWRLEDTLELEITYVADKGEQH